MYLTPKAVQRLAGPVRQSIMVAIGIMLACAFPWIHAPSAKAFVLFWAVAMLLGEAFRIIRSLTQSLPEGNAIRSLTQFLPEGNIRSFLGGLAMVLASVYYLRRGHSTTGVALAWIALLYGGLAAVTTLQKIALDVFVILAIRADYRMKRFPRLAGVPFACVISEPGMGAFYTRRFTGKMMTALGKYRSLPRESGLPMSPGTSIVQRLFFFPRQRAMVYFLDAECVPRREKEFLDWLTMQACALLVVRTSLGPTVTAFREEAFRGLCLCPGPVIDVCLVVGRDRSSCVATPGTEYIEVSGNEQISMANLIAPVTDRLVATAVPIALSDQKLPDWARKLIFEIASSAVPLIADSYLRFRLAQSNVERFIALLDAYENLLKCSVIVLLGARWAAGKADIDAKDRLSHAPSLGDWVRLLGELLSSNYRSTELDRKICDFWHGDSFPMQGDLVKRVKKSVLPCPDLKDSTQVGWMNWMTLLRNQTKGHGIITESSVTPFWHELHLIFLAMVSGLRTLVIASHLLLDMRDEVLPLRGWVRQNQRQEPKGFGPPQLGGPVVLIESPDGERVRLSPLVVFGNGNVLLWDGGRQDVDADGHKKTWIEFVSCSSEKRDRVYSGQTAPYQLWASTATQGHSVATG